MVSMITKGNFFQDLPSNFLIISEPDNRPFWVRDRRVSLVLANGLQLYNLYIHHILGCVSLPKSSLCYVGDIQTLRLMPFLFLVVCLFTFIVDLNFHSLFARLFHSGRILLVLFPSFVY